MKRILKIGNVIVSAVLSGLFFAGSPVAAASEMSNAEKIAFLDKITETKIKKAMVDVRISGFPGTEGGYAMRKTGDDARTARPRRTSPKVPLNS